ncbi:hypothetical protein PR202_ga17236 [Eleusine coracana subsp. coracana]|uniref:Uncharacterized protein n=1 Tax=Eleusine coracana subsp. coracana TaxID=191504 RepID=A0AAV5CPY4_ELECO|nr:hypothetical protein PR202_ga17236 [Eleusine coracana subsp. coracana]
MGGRVQLGVCSEEETGHMKGSVFCLQNAVQNRMMPVIDEAVTDLLNSTKSISRVAIADLGCSSGPNAITLVSGAVNAIFQHCARHEQVPSEICVFLNDLPHNDFNNVAKSLVEFQESDQRIGHVTVGIVPGSFYKRLFTRSSLHLFFFIQQPALAIRDLRTHGIPMYDGDNDLRQARRPLVLEAYARQFKKDFKLFLNSRAQELVARGQILISVLGTRAGDDTSESNLPWEAWDPVASILNDMATREEREVRLKSEAERVRQEAEDKRLKAEADAKAERTRQDAEAVLMVAFWFSVLALPQLVMPLALLQELESTLQLGLSCQMLLAMLRPGPTCHTQDRPGLHLVCLVLHHVCPPRLVLTTRALAPCHT